MFQKGIRPTHWDDAGVVLDGQTLSIDWTGWHFGGSRPLFVCACGRHVLLLFSPDGRQPWRCRACHGLSYATRQLGRRRRLVLKAQKVRERLDGGLGLLAPFPGRPKGMNRARYERLRGRHDDALSESLALLQRDQVFCRVLKVVVSKNLALRSA